MWEFVRVIYIGVVLGALLFMFSARADGPASFAGLRICLIGGLGMVALGIFIAWIDGQNVLKSLMLTDWKAGGTWGIPLGYSLMLGGLLDWVFNRKQSKSE
jgi:hypothetical protein